MVEFRIVDEGTVDGIEYMLVNRWKVFEQKRFDMLMNLGMPALYDYYTGYARVEDEGDIPPNISIAGGFEVNYGPDSKNWIGFDTRYPHTRDTTDDEAKEMVKHFAKGVSEWQT